MNQEENEIQDESRRKRNPKLIYKKTKSKMNQEENEIQNESTRKRSPA